MEQSLPKKQLYYITLMNPDRFSKGVVARNVAEGVLNMRMPPGVYECRAVSPVQVTTNKRYASIFDKLDRMLKAKTIIDYYRVVDPIKGDVCLMVCCDSKEMVSEIKKLETTVAYQ